MPFSRLDFKFYCSCSLSDCRMRDGKAICGIIGAAGAGEAVAAAASWEARRRGKSELHRARMVANGDSGRPGESATEKTPPARARVKRRGKSSPPRWRHRGHGKPHPEQGQTAPYGTARPGAGRPLEPAGNRGPSQITAPASAGTEFGLCPAPALSSRGGPP